MNTHAIIPVKTLAKSKKRLEKLLSIDERIRLCQAMLYDVLDSVSSSSSISRILVVSNDKSILPITRDFGTAFLPEEEESGVNAAVALADRICKDSDADATIVIPQDLPLIMPEDIDMLCSSAREKRCVIVTPSHRYDGTNALLRKPPSIITTHYDEDSYEIHVLKAKEERNLTVKVMLNRRLMLDLDEPDDIAPIIFGNYIKSSSSRTASFLQEIKHKVKL